MAGVWQAVCMTFDSCDSSCDMFMSKRLFLWNVPAWSLQDLGFPCERPRVFVLGFSKSSMIWGGCDDELGRFLSIFGTRCQADGSAYMFEAWPARREDLEQKLKVRRIHLAAGALMRKPETQGSRLAMLLDACNACARAHGEGYEQLWANRADEERNLPYFCDWEQRPQKGKVRPSFYVPTMLTHGAMVEHTFGRSLTNKELFAVHGWETGPCELDVVAASTAKKKIPAKLFLGNSMRIPTVLAVYLYAIVHACRKHVEERAWMLARRSSTWSQEICGSLEAVEEHMPERSSSSALGLRGGRGRGRGMKRPAAATVEDGEDKDEAVADGFRRAKSTIFDRRASVSHASQEGEIEQCLQTHCRRASMQYTFLGLGNVCLTSNSPVLEPKGPQIFPKSVINVMGLIRRGVWQDAYDIV